MTDSFPFSWTKLTVVLSLLSAPVFLGVTIGILLVVMMTESRVKAVGIKHINGLLQGSGVNGLLQGSGVSLRPLA
jgi:hypothetical protein